MTIFIARDGVELGECDRRDLDQLAREGQVQPTDHYWHDGMVEWRLLGDFLGEEIWTSPAPEAPRILKPARAQEAAPAREPIRAPERTVRLTTEPPTASSSSSSATTYRDPREYLRRRKRMPPPQKEVEVSTRARTIAILVFALLLLAGIGTYIFFATRSDRGIRISALFPPQESTPIPLSADAVRDKASNELREKIEHLPAKPGPPLHTFFYDIKVSMQKSVSTRIPWWAVIRGNENVVDPETQKTTLRTDFILTVEYRDGEWTFKHYRATASNMAKEETAEIEEGAKTPMPPSIVGMMGLKMLPRD